MSLITHGSSEEDDSYYGNAIMQLETPKMLILKDSYNCVLSGTGESIWDISALWSAQKTLLLRTQLTALFLLSPSSLSSS